MNKFLGFLKRNSNWLIPTSGILCLLSYAAYFIIQLIYVGGDTDYLNNISSFVSGIFVYAVGVFMMMHGKAKGNMRMQYLIVILSSVYYGVSAFIGGVQGLFVSFSGLAILFNFILSFVIGLVWVFILYEGCYGYLQNNLDRRVNRIAFSGFVLIILEFIGLILNLINLIIGAAITEFWYVLIYFLPSLTSFLYILGIYSTYIDVMISGSNINHHKLDKQYKVEKKKDKEDFDDLDIHSF